MAVAVACNLAILGWFKYAGFLAAQFGIVSLSKDPPHLPLGISFITFHAISYLIDINRGDARAESITARAQHFYGSLGMEEKPRSVCGLIGPPRHAIIPRPSPDGYDWSAGVPAASC